MQPRPEEKHCAPINAEHAIIPRQTELYTSALQPLSICDSEPIMGNPQLRE
jgi:hypothetical protein